MTKNEIDIYVAGFLTDLWNDRDGLRFSGLAGLSDRALKESLDRLVKAGKADCDVTPFSTTLYKLSEK
jgi:hypothetical protein